MLSNQDTHLLVPSGTSIMCEWLNSIPVTSVKYLAYAPRRPLTQRSALWAAATEEQVRAGHATSNAHTCLQPDTQAEFKQATRTHRVLGFLQHSYSKHHIRNPPAALLKRVKTAVIQLCQTSPFIYHTDGEHVVTAGKCAATHPISESSFCFQLSHQYTSNISPLFVSTYHRLNSIKNT